ncbi:MAG: hypothetical protein ACXVXW_13920 [Mycobacteriaceae bacterium]
MYRWLWRHLPGGTAVRAACAAAVVLAVMVTLFLVVFPAIEAHVPLGNDTVSGH